MPEAACTVVLLMMGARGTRNMESRSAVIRVTAQLHRVGLSDVQFNVTCFNTVTPVETLINF